MKKAGGKQEHGRNHVKRVMCTSVSGYTTSGLVHIGHRREKEGRRGGRLGFGGG